MDFSHSRRGAILGALCAIALLACSGSSPTEVAPSEPAPSEPLIVTDPHPPGEIVGCPREWNGVAFGEYVPLATLVGGAVVEFIPPQPEVNCTTRINNGRRTMTVDLMLGEGQFDGERDRFEFADTCAVGQCWECPVQGPVADADRLLYTQDYRFRIDPDGRLTGRCVAFEDL